MITPDLKKIFSIASKKNEAFVREAISVFPKIEVTKLTEEKLKKLEQKNKEKV